MKIIAYILSGSSFLMSVLLPMRLKVTKSGLILWSFKLVAGALSPLWAIIGAAGSLIGAIYGAYWAVPIGIITAVMMIIYIWQCSREHKGFDDAFGPDCKDKIHPQQTKNMVNRRWSFLTKMKTTPVPSCKRDISFWTFPASKRELLCDLWQPENGNVSGLAFIYFHGSG